MLLHINALTGEDSTGDLPSEDVLKEIDIIASPLVEAYLVRDDAEKFVRASGPSRVVFTKCDVSKREHLEGLASASLMAFNAVPDVWVAGAGVFEPVSILRMTLTIGRC